MPVSLQKQFRTSLMWPYASSSFKHLLIEDHKHYAYMRLYIQEILSEAWLSVSSSTLSIPKACYNPVTWKELPLIILLGIHSNFMADLQCTNSRISLWYHLKIA